MRTHVLRQIFDISFPRGRLEDSKDYNPVQNNLHRLQLEVLLCCTVPDLGQSSHCSTSSTLVDIDISAVNVFLWSSLLTGAGLGVPKWIASFGFKSNIEEVFRKDSFMTFFRELNSGLWCFLTMTSVQFRKQSVIFVILFTRWIILITFISFYFIFIFYFILSWVHLYSKYMKKF